MSPRLIVVGILAVLTALSFDDAPAQEATADQILVNGRILTVDEDFSVAAGLAIAGEKILAVGTDAEVRRLAGPDTRVIDLEGRTVIPGLIDNHSHMTGAARTWGSEARLEGVASRREALGVISARAEALGEGQWVMALRGWTPGQFLDEPGPFTREELDRAAPDNPVLTASGMTRVGTANSKAMEAAGITEPTVEGAGAVNGMLRAAASPHSWAEGVAFISADFARVGLTTVYDPRAPNYEPLEEAYESGELSIRVFHSLNGQGGRGASTRTAGVIAEELRTIAPLQGNDRMAQFGFGEDTIRSLRDTGARPWVRTDEIEADYRAISMAGAEAGWQLHEHSMQEGKISFVIDTFEEVNEIHPIENLRWTLHHATQLSISDIPRLKALNMSVAVHSHGALQEMRATELEQVVMSGPPMKALEEAGVIWGLGTDFGGPPITIFNPFLTLSWAVTGKSLPGATVNTNPVARQAALVAHTRSNAYILHKEQALGTLEPGKYADLVVLDRDYMTIPAEEIKEIRPVMTMVGGRVVFQ